MNCALNTKDGQKNSVCRTPLDSCIPATLVRIKVSSYLSKLNLRCTRSLVYITYLSLTAMCRESNDTALRVSLRGHVAM